MVVPQLPKRFLCPCALNGASHRVRAPRLACSAPGRRYDHHGQPPQAVAGARASVRSVHKRSFLCYFLAHARWPGLEVV